MDSQEVLRLKHQTLFRVVRAVVVEYNLLHHLDLLQVLLEYTNLQKQQCLTR